MRVLLLHASAGSGHKRAAEALAKAFAREAPQAQITISDILDFTPAIFRDTYAKGYLRVVRLAPELWGYMYALSDRKAAIPWRRKVRSAFNAINTGAFRRFLKETRPDVVVCTHFLPLELLATRSMRRTSPAALYCVVTDFAVHSLWMVDNVQGYYVATDDARLQLLLRGNPAERVRVTGIPVDPAFSADMAPPDARRKLGLKPELPAVLVMCGGFGVGPVVGLLEAFRGAPADLQLLVVAGANEKLRGKCQAIADGLGVPVRVHGFVNNVHDLMLAADLVVTKSGGLTSSEVIALGRPLVIVDPIPGQEQRNCEYLLESGAATRLYETNAAPHKLRALLGDAARLERMRRCAQAIGRPQAAAAVARDILARCEADARAVAAQVRVASFARRSAAKA